MHTKLNLCCGLEYKEGYHNVDFSFIGSNGEPLKIDDAVNVLHGLPYENNTFEEVYFCEALEHFNRQNGLDVLKSIYRVLDRGGKLVLTVPPALQQMQRLVKAILDDIPVTMADFYETHNGTMNYWKILDDMSGATHSSDGFDGDSHKCFYSPKALVCMLEYVGFKIDSLDQGIIKVEATKL